MRYELKDFMNVALHNRDGHEIMNIDSLSVSTKETNRVLSNPVYYLIELEKDVDQSMVNHFDDIGLYVVVAEIEDHPNWLVIKWVVPYLKQTIEKMLYVKRVREVKLELEAS